MYFIISILNEDTKKVIFHNQNKNIKPIHCEFLFDQKRRYKMANEERFVLDPNKKLKVIEKLRISLSLNMKQFRNVIKFWCLITINELLFGG